MEEALQRIEQKIDAMGGRLDKVAERLGKVDERLGKVDVSFGRVEGRLNAVESGQSRLTMMVQQQGVLQEALRDNLKQTLEGVIFLRESTGRRFDEVVAKLDERVQPIELATRDLATKKPRTRG